MKILLYPLCMEHKLSWWEQQKLPVQGLSFKLHVVHSLQAFKKLVLEKSKLLISLLSEDLQPGRCPAGCRYVVKNGLKIHLPASLSPSLCPPEWCVTQHCHNCSHQLQDNRGHSQPGSTTVGKQGLEEGGRKEIGSCFPLPAEQHRKEGEDSVSRPYVCEVQEEAISSWVLCHGGLLSPSPARGKPLAEEQHSKGEGSSGLYRNENYSHKVFRNQEVKASWWKQEEEVKKGRQCQLHKLGQ